MCTCLCVQVCMYVYVRTCMCVRAFLYICTCTCLCECMYVYVRCVHGRTCMRSTPNIIVTRFTPYITPCITPPYFPPYFPILFLEITPYFRPCLSSSSASINTYRHWNAREYGWQCRNAGITDALALRHVFLPSLCRCLALVQQLQDDFPELLSRARHP
jgi:hypothetical protein